jgi:transposase
MSDTEFLLKPKAVSEPELVRRVEVFTGTGRRRRWTPEQKALIVAESYEASETVSAVARRRGLTTQQLFTWRRDARRAQAGASRMAFTPVVLEGSRPRSGSIPIAQHHSDNSPVIEIVMGAATVRVPPGTEPATLQVVLHELTTALR